MSLDKLVTCSEIPEGLCDDDSEGRHRICVLQANLTQDAIFNGQLLQNAEVDDKNNYLIKFRDRGGRKE